MTIPIETQIAYMHKLLGRNLSVLHTLGDSKRSVIFQQARREIDIQKAILETLKTAK